MGEIVNLIIAVTSPRPTHPLTPVLRRADIRPWAQRELRGAHQGRPGRENIGTQETLGRVPVHGRARSNALLALNTVASSSYPPMICRPTGIPLSPKPQGIEAAGLNDELKIIVKGMAP